MNSLRDPELGVLRVRQRQVSPLCDRTLARGELHGHQRRGRVVRQPAPVQEGPVLTPEVAQQPMHAVPLEGRMLARHMLPIDHEVACA